MDGDEKMIIKI